MRIIKNPNPAEETILICEKCECEFAYNYSDIHRDSWNNGIIGPGFYAYTREYVICPNCGISINIGKKDNYNTSYDTVVVNEMFTKLLENE